MEFVEPRWKLEAARGHRARWPPRDPVRVAIQQLTSKGELVGGNTLIFKRVRVD